MPSELNHWTHMLGQQTVMTSCAMSIWSELRQGHCPLGWLVDTTDVVHIICSACQTEIHPSVVEGGLSFSGQSACVLTSKTFIMVNCSINLTDNRGRQHQNLHCHATQQLWAKASDQIWSQFLMSSHHLSHCRIVHQETPTMVSSRASATGRRTDGPTDRRADRPTDRWTTGWRTSLYWKQVQRYWNY